jgi:hypothetical protein
MIEPLPSALERALAAELRAGERLVYAGRPRPRSLRALVLVGGTVGPLVALGSAWFLAYAYLVAATPPVLPGGVPAGAVGLLLVPGIGQSVESLSVPRFLARTVCFVTDRRAGTMHAGRVIRVRSWAGGELARARVTARDAAGRGTIEFDAPAAGDLRVRIAARRETGERRTYRDTVLEGFRGVPAVDGAMAAIDALRARDGTRQNA